MTLTVAPVRDGRTRAASTLDEATGGPPAVAAGATRLFSLGAALPQPARTEPKTPISASAPSIRPVGFLPMSLKSISVPSLSWFRSSSIRADHELSRRGAPLLHRRVAPSDRRVVHRAGARDHAGALSSGRPPRCGRSHGVLPRPQGPDCAFTRADAREHFLAVGLHSSVPEIVALDLEDRE